MKQHLPRARIRRGSGIRHEFGERTTAVEEGGPEGGPAEAGGGRGCREPQARRRSPNLHRFGRGSSRERNGEMILFPPFFRFFFLLSFSAWYFDSLYLRGSSSCGEERRWEETAISGRVEWFPLPRETVESWKPNT